MDEKMFDVGFDHDGYGYSLVVDGLEDMTKQIEEFFRTRYAGGPVTLHIEPMDEDDDE